MADYLVAAHRLQQALLPREIPPHRLKPGQSMIGENTTIPVSQLWIHMLAKDLWQLLIRSSMHVSRLCQDSHF